MRLSALLLTTTLTLAAATAVAGTPMTADEHNRMPWSHETEAQTPPPTTTAAKPMHHRGMRHHKGKGTHGTMCKKHCDHAMTPHGDHPQAMAEPAYQSHTGWPIPATNPNHPLAPAGAW